MRINLKKEIEYKSWIGIYLNYFYISDTCHIHGVQIKKSADM